MGTWLVAAFKSRAFSSTLHRFALPRVAPSRLVRRPVATVRKFSSRPSTPYISSASTTPRLPSTQRLLTQSSLSQAAMEFPERSLTRASAACVADRLERPELDDRTYRVIRLPNELEALLIHDPKTDKASAALDVNAGAFSDARDMPGMAHAVEHLLFMGTKKYPSENEYNRYLTAHNGHSNAYTASTSTNYYFEISVTPDSAQSQQVNGTSNGATTESSRAPLYGALDRFAQFFIEPLFLEETLDRELHAVDSENKKNLQSDVWRLNQLAKSTSNPKHPYSGFSTGNLQTLRDEPLARGVKIRDEFIKFHTDHYSANRMKLVVLGLEPLDELQTWVEELFSDVVNKNLLQNRWDDTPLYTEEELQTQVNGKPVMNTRQLDIEFPYRDETEMYESKPAQYLSHLLGHEGSGSILAYVKAKGWVNGLSAGYYQVCPGSAAFSIRLTLTQEGLEKYKVVVKSVFQYISILRESKPQEWIFGEMKGLGELEFRFKEKSPASSTTSRLSAVMQSPIPREWLLKGAYVYSKFDADAIRQGLAYLRADNFRIFLNAQDSVTGDIRHEKWYGTEYTLQDLSKSFIEELQKAESSTAQERPKELHLPSKNEFIPYKLDVEKKEVGEPSRFPKLVRKEDNVRLWHKKDDQFWVPKGNVYVNLRSLTSSLTPRNAVQTELFLQLVQDALVEYAYDAELAGLSYNLGSSSGGLAISVNGYNDKMAVLLEKVLACVRDIEIKDDRFEIIKERATRGYKNSLYGSPFRQISRYTRFLTNSHSWSTEQKIAEIDSITAQDIREFHPLLLKQLHIEALVHGNFYLEDALKLTDLTEKTLAPVTLPETQWPVSRSVMLSPGSNYIYPHTLADPENVNHCIHYMLYAGSVADRATVAKLQLLAQMTNESAFNRLRTKEQLGYVVFSGNTASSGNASYYVLVQSDRRPEYVEKRIEAYLRRFKAEELAPMSSDDFEAHRRAAVNKRLERLKNLDQESGRFWAHIDNERYHFEASWDDAAELRKLTKQDIVTFFDEFIDPESKRRAKLSVHMLAQAAAEPEPKDGQHEGDEYDKPQVIEPVVIGDAAAFKASMPLTPGPRPFKDLSNYEELAPKL